MKYEIEEKNPDWFNKGPWYIKTICYKLHGTEFEDFIINSRTYRYNIICSITEYYRQQPTYVDDSISAGGVSIPKNATTSALKSLGANLNFIYCWLKHLHRNYQ